VAELAACPSGAREVFINTLMAEILHFEGCSLFILWWMLLSDGCINPSAWGHLNPSSYCDVGRFFYMVFKF